MEVLIVTGLTSMDAQPLSAFHPRVVIVRGAVLEGVGGGGKV